MDQKANSVADLAAVLLQQEKGPNEKRIDRYKRAFRRFKYLEYKGSKKIEGKQEPVDVVTECTGVNGVKVFWKDIFDAQYAATWPKDVVHLSMGGHRYTIAWPTFEGEISTPGQEEGAKQAAVG